MALTDTALNTGVNAIKATATHVSLHTADPGLTGTAEATGGSPAYARQAATWGSAVSGDVSATQVTFDLPAGTYTHWGMWTASTAGTFLGGGALNANQVLSSQGQIKLTPTIDLD